MSQSVVSHAAILSWFQTQLPNQDEEKDSLIYHLPVRPQAPYKPEKFGASTAILSLTPTEGVYEHLKQDPQSRKIVFLHRPWGLDRFRIPRGTLVLQSHQRFDEMYTTGYNVSFALKHNVNFDTVSCMKGYKGDPERRIGLLGELKVVTSLAKFLLEVDHDFEGIETLALGEDLTQPIRAIASLNAFDADIIERVRAGLEGIPCEQILCITGAAREAGMLAAKECGLQVICVGHRRSEIWGIRHLARKMQEDLGIDDVKIVDEPDFVIPRKPKTIVTEDPVPTTEVQNT